MGVTEKNAECIKDFSGFNAPTNWKERKHTMSSVTIKLASLSQQHFIIIDFSEYKVSAPANSG